MGSEASFVHGREETSIGIQLYRICHQVSPSLSHSQPYTRFKEV